MIMKDNTKTSDKMTNTNISIHNRSMDSYYAQTQSYTNIHTERVKMIKF